MWIVFPHVGWRSVSPLRLVTLHSGGIDRDAGSAGKTSGATNGAAGGAKASSVALAVGATQIYQHAREQGLVGLNLSYLVRSTQQGRGLGTLVSYGCAFAQMQWLFRRESEKTALRLMEEGIVSAQCASDNLAGQALARRLGLLPDERLSFQVPAGEDAAKAGIAGLRYEGFSLDCSSYMERAWSQLSSASAQSIRGGPPLEMIEAQREWLRGLHHRRCIDRPRMRA